MTNNQKLEKGKIYSLDEEDGFTYIGSNVYGEEIFTPHFIEDGGKILMSTIKKEIIEINGTDIKSKDSQYHYSFISMNAGDSELTKIINNKTYSQLAKIINGIKNDK